MSIPLPDPLAVSDDCRTPPSEGCEPCGGAGAGAAAAPLARRFVSPRALCLPGGSCGSGRQLLFGDGVSTPVLPPLLFLLP